MIDPVEDFIGIDDTDVDGFINRIIQLNAEGVVDVVVDTQQMSFEALAMRIVNAGGDVDEFNRKLNALPLK